MCLSASRPCGLHQGVNTRLPARNGAYHDVAVDIFDDKVAYILNGSIWMILVQLPGFAGRVFCRIRMDSGEQAWVEIVDVVRVAKEL
jgi:hypothetical protein